MRVLYLFSLLIIFSLNISAQENRDFTEIYENAEAVLFTQPQQTSKITSHLIQNSENSSEKIKAYILNAGSQYAMGEYNNEVTALLAAKTLAESSNDIQSQIRISVLSIPLLNNLGLNAVAEKYYLKIKVLSKNSKNEQNSFYLSAAKILIEAQKHSEHDNAIESLNTLEAANAHFKKIPDIILQTQTEVKILETYSSAKGIDSAKIYFTKILKNKNKASINDFITMVALNQMGKIFFLQKEYLNARISFENALDISNELENKTYRSKIIDGLSATFLAMDDTSNFFSNRTKSDSLANEAEMEEENAINTLYNYINTNTTQIRDTIQKEQKQKLLISATILILIFLIWIILRLRYNFRCKQYESFIRYFEKERAPPPLKTPKELPKSLNIPKETESLLANKLKQFENTKLFVQQDMSLATLASHFDTNTKYLSEIINTHKNKNFNSYINELRINYIIDKLKNNSVYSQYKISYLAEESGFSSHSTFATVFKSVTGIPPTTFIDMLKTTKNTTKPSYEEVE